jgi:membrane-associated phospholipid phosphatase
MNIIDIINYIGALAPIILFIVTVCLLNTKHNYLKFFISGFILNNVLNVLLKLSIKEPRPSSDRKIIEIAIYNGERVSFDNYGMPSGHAQNCGYCLAFITMVYNSPIITGLYLIISCLSMYQRHSFNNHTTLQLLVGFIIGLFMGYVLYIITNKYIVGNIKEKGNY